MNDPFDIPADLDTPVSAYLKLSSFGRRFLLESVASPSAGERQARYSFLGFGEGELVRLDVDEVARGATVAERRDSVLARMRAALAAAPELADPGAGLPFDGGLVGLASYGLAAGFERLPGLARDASTPDLLAFAPRSVLVFDHERRRMALLAAGDEGERAGLRREVLRALRGPLPLSGTPAGFATPVPGLDRAAFVESVAGAQGAIADGEVFQLVLSSRFRAACDLAPFDVYRALRLLNPSPYQFILELGERAIVGASPEALVRMRDRRATLQPIAGTRPRGSDDASDRRNETELVADPKEAAEHVMLVDLARNDLGRVSTPGSISVGPYKSVERFSHVMHLVSGVNGLVEEGFDALDVFAACFPAGTVVGAPKARAMELIGALEPEPRGFYAGSIGSFGHGDTLNQAIAIRTLAFSPGEVEYQAGAGIVADSDPEAEFDEVLHKSAAMRAALELAAGGLQ